MHKREAVESYVDVCVVVLCMYLSRIQEEKGKYECMHVCGPKRGSHVI